LLVHSYPAPSFLSATTTLMWLVRLTTCAARPCARGRNRLRVGPSSTSAWAIPRSSSSNRSEASSALNRAFATAEPMTLEIVFAAACGANSTCVSASLAPFPRMVSTTRRAFMGVTRTYRACALASIVFLPSYCSEWTASAATTLTVVLIVSAEGPRRSEFAEFVADHRLGDVHRDVLAAIVDGERVAEEVRGDHRTTRPGLDNGLRALFVLCVHLLLEVIVNERPLL